MRHRKSGRKLGRDSSHRRAMFRNMTISLFEHELIKTTLPKAKELRRVVEPLITLAKTDSVANRRLAFARLGSKAAVCKLFEDLGPRYQERPGGYMRLLKCGFRNGDAAPMTYVELVDRPIIDDVDLDDDVETVVAEPVSDSQPVIEAEPVSTDAEPKSEDKKAVSKEDQTARDADQSDEPAKK